jgi:hypothetical protein
MTGDIPARFNFARDVVDRGSGLALVFLDPSGARRVLSFEEVAAAAARRVASPTAVTERDRILSSRPRHAGARRRHGSIRGSMLSGHGLI